MFAVDGLVKIRFPCASSTVTSIFVVVDFPEDPDTTTSPSGKCDRTEPRNPGATLFTTRPGTADPPPRLRSRAATRAARPTRTAGAQWMPGGREVTRPVFQTASTRHGGATARPDLRPRGGARCIRFRSFPLECPV